MVREKISRRSSGGREWIDMVGETAGDYFAFFD